MIEGVLKWGIKLDTHIQGMWSVGMSLSHWNEETYLYINFFKWIILIGKFYH